MKKLNLNKVMRAAMLVFAACVLLFTIGAWDRIMSYETPGGFRFFWAYFPAVVILGILLFLYLLHLKRADRAGKEPFGLRMIRTVYKYRFLIEQLVSRDFKIKYKRSVLGVFWSFLNPLLMMLVQYVVFSHLLNIRGGVEHYAIYLLAGIVIWNGFNDCSTQAMRSITGSSALITKVYVPKTIYPVTKVFSAGINVLLSMIPLILVTVIYGLFQTPKLLLTKAVLLLPFGLFFLLIFCIGMGFLLSSLMVFFRDVEFLWTVFASIWMYGTPIIYSLSMFGDKAAWLVKLMQFNPMYHYISFVRTILLEGVSPVFSEYLISILCSALMFAVGLFVFRKTEDRFILYL